MSNRKPYKLEKLLIFYNLIQVIVSSYLFFEVKINLNFFNFYYFKIVSFDYHKGMDGAWLTRYNWRCQPVDFSKSDEAMRVKLLKKKKICFTYII